jgi:phosphatidylinositol-3-phosphatase
MGSLREIRLSWPAFAALVVASAIATAVVVSGAQGTPVAGTAARAALRDGQQVLLVAAAQKATSASTGTGGSRSRTPSRRARHHASAAPGVVPAASAGTTPAPGAAPAPAVSSSAPATSTPATTSTSTSTTTATSTPLPKVKHVFLIALTTPSFRAAFGRGSKAVYLRRVLERKGTVLRDYRSLAAGELPDYLAMVSGQAPNRDTRAGCTSYTDFSARARIASTGAIRGPGCIYPNTVLTLGDQVTASGHTWRAYITDMGTSTCVHPNSGASATTPLPGTGPEYDLAHNPFIYFHSLLDLGDCSNDDVALTELPHDLARSGRTAAFSFITPGACDDASASTCPDGAPAGIAGEDAFLKTWVPAILRSPGYRHGGVLIVAFAHASASPGRGATATGALVISRHTPRHRTLTKAYDAYSLLRTVEDMLGYQPLARAKTAASFAAQVLGS